jgi:hypothetical protein
MTKATCFEPPETIDVDGVIDERTRDRDGWGHVQFIGKATRQPDGTWRVLANVGGTLCVVECSLRQLPNACTVRSLACEETAA